MLERETRGALFLNRCDKPWMPDMARLLASRFPRPYAAETPHDYRIVFHHHGENIGPIARAQLAHKLPRTGRCRYVITIDDDRIVPSSFLATLVSEARPALAIRWLWKNVLAGGDQRVDNWGLWRIRWGYRLYECAQGFAPVAYANLVRLDRSAITLFDRIKEPSG